VNEGTEDKRAEVVGVSSEGVLTRQLQGNRDRTIDTRFGRLQAAGRYDGSMHVALVNAVPWHGDDLRTRTRHAQ
jgi:hypothetical protein